MRGQGLGWLGSCCASAHVTQLSRALALASSPAGVLFQVALIPDAHFDMGNEGPGCFTHLGGQFIRKDQAGGCWPMLEPLRP